MSIPIILYIAYTSIIYNKHAALNTWYTVLHLSLIALYTHTHIYKLTRIDRFLRVAGVDSGGVRPAGAEQGVVDVA